MTSDQSAPVRRRRRWPYVVATIVVVLAVAVLLFRWSWLIPIIEARASAALGRPVALRDLHVTLGGVTHVVADDVSIGNPVGWPGGGQFATVEHLVIDFNVERFIRTRQLEFPTIAVQRPDLGLSQLADGNANWRFATGGGAGSDAKDGQAGAEPAVDHLVISDGTVKVRSLPLKADFSVGISTRTGSSGTDEIVADAKGTYANQPITAEFVGGALLSLQDKGVSYPVDLRVKNGPTAASAKGTIDRPLAFAGLDARLELSGPDMALLLPLTGIAIPKTPPYRVSGHLALDKGVVTVEDFQGKVGSSDIGGKLAIDPTKGRPDLTAALASKSVDLDDLSGFIGAEPSGSAKPGAPAKPAPARADKRVLPNEPLSVPKLTAADVHLTYAAAKIQGRHQPLDSMKVALDIVDGDVRLHPLEFTIGRGDIASDITLSQQNGALAAKADVKFQHVDVSKLLGATGIAEGAGAISGQARIDGSGKSIADFLAQGNGELKLYMGSGGNLSALLVDLSGLHFGDALLSALGIPTRTKIDCLVTDFVLTRGVAQSRLTLVDTDEARIGLTGNLDLRNEGLDLVLRTEAKHFTVGSLPAPIGLGGTFGSPSINPDYAALGARAAAAGGLGVLLGPVAAILPTIQTGIGEDGACSGLVREVQTPAVVRPPPPAAPARATRRGATRHR